jgi:hypothetical protein
MTLTNEPQGAPAAPVLSYNRDALLPERAVARLMLIPCGLGAVHVVAAACAWWYIVHDLGRLAKSTTLTASWMTTAMILEPLAAVCMTLCAVLMMAGRRWSAGGLLWSCMAFAACRWGEQCFFFAVNSHLWWPLRLGSVQEVGREAGYAATVAFPMATVAAVAARVRGGNTPFLRGRGLWHLAAACFTMVAINAVGQAAAAVWNWSDWRILELLVALGMGAVGLVMVVAVGAAFIGLPRGRRGLQLAAILWMAVAPLPSAAVILDILRHGALAMGIYLVAGEVTRMAMSVAFGMTMLWVLDLAEVRELRRFRHGA